MQQHRLGSEAHDGDGERGDEGPDGDDVSGSTGVATPVCVFSETTRRGCREYSR